MELRILGLWHGGTAFALASRDRLPVAVIFKPGPEASERSNNRVLPVMAYCWVSTSVRSEARRIVQVTGDGVRLSAVAFQIDVSGHVMFSSFSWRASPKAYQTYRPRC